MCPGRSALRCTATDVGSGLLDKKLNCPAFYDIGCKDSARRAQSKMKSLGFSFSLLCCRLSWRSKVCNACLNQNEKPCKVREKKEKNRKVLQFLFRTEANVMKYVQRKSPAERKETALPVAVSKCFGKGSWKLFHHLFKLIFAYAAERANPIVGNVFKGSSGFNATFGVANGRVVHPLAHNAIILFHVDVNKM